MAKSNRKRKRDRAVRQAKAARKRSGSLQRRIAEAAVQRAVERLERMWDPATPAGELGRLLAIQYEGAPVLPGLAELLIDKGSSAERLVEAAEALPAAEAAQRANAEAAQRADAEIEERQGSAGIAGGRPSLTFLTFGAAAARAAGDTERARRLIDEALSAATDPDDRLRVIMHLSVQDRVAEALELLEGLVRGDPADDRAARHYASTLERAFSRLDTDDPPGNCPCGSGDSWRDCCAPRERAALDRFGDRSGLVALQDALAAYLSRSEYGQAVADFVAEWRSLAEAGDWGQAERASFGQMAGELALVTAGTSPGDSADDSVGDEAGAGDDLTADEADNAMAAFAADPGTPPELAARARAWRAHMHYGLWQIAEPEPAPGLWCTDVVTGVERYVEFPAGLVSGFPRWGVLLGGVLPVDGVWRCTGQAVQLSPAEADALAETIADATDAVLSRLSGRSSKRAARRTRRPVPFGHAGPHNVLAYHAEELPGEAVRLVSAVVGSMLLRLLTELYDHRATPPALTNTDGDPMCLIKARIAVRDAGALAGRLADHADFDPDPDDPAHLAWLGRVIPEGQRAAMLAEASAQLGSEASAGEVLSDEGPGRWIRGQLHVRDGELVADVNSRERLARLLGLLSELGESPSVIEETRVDPAEDLAWPAGPRLFARGAAPPEQGWEKHWLDERVPALHGRTPRQAAHTQERTLLEALLREFEYEADLLTAEGKQGIDTAWLRSELDMPSDSWE